jgi:SprB repeat
VNLGASGGTSPYQYSKDGTNFQGTIGFTGFVAGTYTFTVKDAKGCVKTINATITEPTLLVATASTTQQVSCFGGNNGTIQVSGSGGTSPYQYSNNGTSYVTTNSFSGLTVGSYSYWVKDANGCVKTTTSTAVSQPTDIIIISLNTKNDVKCFGGNDGSLSVTAGGGTGTLTYSKDGTNFQASNSFTNLTAQTYTIYVKDQNACIRTFSIQILQPTAFTISSVSNQNLSCFGNNTGRIEVLGTGGTANYQYSLNNINFQNSNVFSGLGAGTYTVYAKDANNCLFNLANNTINQPSDINVSLLEKVDVDCDYYQKGSFKVGASGGVGSFTYNMTGQDLKFNPIAGQSNTTGVFTSLFAGNYVINVQDATGCVRPFPVTIVPKNSKITFNIVKTLPTSCSTTDGTITINSVGGGNNPYQYRLSTQNVFVNSNTFNNLGNGSYIITVADGLCAYNQSVDLSLPNSLKATYTISPISCAVPNGNLTVTGITGGNGNYSLALDGTNFSSSTVYNNLTPNVYALTLKDSPLSCQSVVSLEIKEQNRADLTLTNKTDILCNGAATGAITMIGNNNLGPFTYGLNQKVSFGASGTFTGLNSGTYKMYAKTNIGCIDSLQVTLSQPTVVTGNVTKKDNDCFGDNTANLNASASGGVGPYTYSIDGINYGTNASFTGLVAGNYTLNIKDANACILPKSVTIVQPSLLVPSTSIGQNVSCFGGTDGSVVVSGTGGTSPYQFSNDNVNFTTNNTFGSLVTNSYTYFVKDAKGCTKQTSAITVTQPTLLVPSITSNINVTCFGGSDGQILMAASGGTSPYQYSADQTNYQTGTNLTGLLVGTFTVSVKDAKGCVKNLTQTLTQPNDLIPTPTVTNAVSCFGGSDGKITYSSVGGTSPYQYSADNVTYQTNNYFDNLTAQNYSYWVKDSKGCTKQAVAIGVSQPTVLVPSVLNQGEVSCFGGTDGNINLQAIGGTSPYQYSKDGTTFQSSVSFTNFSQGSYTFTVKDAKNCIKTLPVTISEPTNLVVSGSVIKNVLCFAGNTGEIQVAGTGGTSPYQYSADGTTYVASNTFTNLTAQGYTYYVKDAKGCVKITASQTITQPTLIVPIIQSFTNVSCNGGSDGIIQALATGGVSPYQYAIAGTYQPSATFNNLLFGSYTVTIKDNNGCTKTVNQTLTQPAPGVASSTVTNNVSCFGGNDGEVSVTTSGGTSPYQYSADNITFQSSNIFGALTAQNNYKYYVKDAKGCIQITPVIGVSEPTLLVPAIANQANVLCFGGSTGAIILASTGGTTPYYYSKDGTSYQTSTTFTGFIKGTYTFSIKDSKGCVKTINTNITEPTDLVVNGVVSKTVLCFAGNTGEMQVNGIGGTSPYTYSADGTTYLSNNAFTALTANSYTFYVKDFNGCIKQTSPKTVTQPTLLVPSV